MDQDADLAVCLTTSGFIHVTDQGDHTLEIDLFTKDIPVCSACHVLDLPSNLGDSTLVRIRRVLLTGLRHVNVNSDLRSIYIGIDEYDEDTATVLYKAHKDSPHINAFFDRWEEIQTMLFEHTLKDINNNIIACVQGWWVKDSWLKLSIIPKPLIEILEPGT